MQKYIRCHIVKAKPATLKMKHALDEICGKCRDGDDASVELGSCRLCRVWNALEEYNRTAL